MCIVFVYSFINLIYAFQITIIQAVTVYVGANLDIDKTAKGLFFGLISNNVFI